MSFRVRYSSLISKLTLALACSPALVRAEPTAADKVLSVQLFRDGKALMDGGKLSDACPKLEESQRLDPGGGTLLNVALCHEKQGRTATAWQEFVEALGVARRDQREDRVEFAQTHIASLEGNLPTITLVVAPESDAAGLELRRDGAVVGRPAWGTAIPVDPGEHVVEASAPSRKTWRTVYSVGTEGHPRVLSVPVPALEAGPPPDPGAPATSPTGAPATSPGTTSNSYAPADVRVDSGSGQRTWGFVALGVGVVGAGLGTVFGLSALSKKSDSDDECRGDVCTRRGVESNRDAGRFADFATVGFGVGLAGALTGVVLLATAPSSRETHGDARGPRLAVSPLLWPGTVGLGGSGRF